MQLEFEVHRASPEVLAKTVDVSGETVKAEIKALEVELTSVADDHGTLTLRFFGASADAAKAIFVPGKRVIGEFSAV